MQSGHPGWHEGITDFTSKCGYLIADIKQMSSADNFNSFRLHACLNVNELNLSLKVQ